MLRPEDPPAGLRRRMRPVRRTRFRGWRIKLVEPPLQRGIAAVSRWGWRNRAALRLIVRTAEADMHMGRMIVPGANEAQPGPIAGHAPTELPFDRRIDQHPVHPWQGRRQPQHRHHILAPHFRFRSPPIGADEGGQGEVFAGGKGQPCTRPHVERDVGIQADLMTDMTAWHGPTAGVGDIFHQQSGQSGRGGGASQSGDALDGARRTPEAGMTAVNGLEAGTVVGQPDRAGNTAADGGSTDDAGGTWCRCGGRRGRRRRSGQQRQKQPEKAPRKKLQRWNQNRRS